MFNNNGPIVPQMQDRTKGTYAETKAEIEARKRAQMAADAAMLAAREAESKKKSPWLAILTVLFAAIALAAAGFAVYEYFENDKLKAELEKANHSYSSARADIETLKKENSALRAENDDLLNQLNDLAPSSEETDSTETIEK